LIVPWWHAPTLEVTVMARLQIVTLPTITIEVVQ